MIWIPIVAGAIVILLFAVIYYFFRIAFVRTKDRPYLDEKPKSKEHEHFYNLIDEGSEWYESAPKEDVYIESYDGLRLHGEIIRASEETNRTIILFHGYRSIAKKDFSCAIPYYHSLGLNIILIDQRAHGKSEGKLITYGVKERYDACSWVELAKEKFPGSKIYLSGISMGSSTVMMASDILKGVSGIVADCGFTSPKEIIQLVAKKEYKLPKWCCAPVGLFARIFGGFDYSYSAERSLAKTNIPILFIHGKADDFVPCYMTDKNFEACASDKRKIIVENATHGFSFLFAPKEVKDGIERFILKNEE